MLSRLILSPHSFLTEVYEIIQSSHVLSITRGMKPLGLTLQQSVERPLEIHYFKYIYHLKCPSRVGVAILSYVVCLAYKRRIDVVWRNCAKRPYFTASNDDKRQWRIASGHSDSKALAIVAYRNLSCRRIRNNRKWKWQKQITAATSAI